MSILFHMQKSNQSNILHYFDIRFIEVVYLMINFIIVLRQPAETM